MFAAFAPSSAVPGLQPFVKQLKPKPVLHVAGEEDEIVPFDLSKKLIEAIREHNGCQETGEKWKYGGTIYPSDSGTPFVAWVHPGGHRFPDKAAEAMVQLFKANPKK